MPLTIPPPSWLMLITNLPGRNQTPRMRIWRALKAAGGELLRDGVYLLPYSSAARRIFEEQRQEISGAGGTAYVMPFESDSPEQQAEFVKLFDRSADYQGINTQLNALKRAVAGLSELDARRQFAAIARDVTALQAVDFFPGKSSKQLQELLVDAQSALNAQFSPNEPQAVHRKIPRRDVKDFQGKLWATRERMWIDRVCSAWLIRRFIDKQAKFVWLKHIKDQPKRALGFDFDGAEFSHVDSKVTFEVLLASFSLDTDIGLSRLGSLVHFLDVGGIPVAEAAGLAAIVSGIRTLQVDDDALLKRVSPMLDGLYQSYATSERQESAKSQSTATQRVTKSARRERR
ncbi:MAG TPA: chromate resistance protein ChrB domain-containing protein [Steroidobacteraceae bacterium]|nr:chromate resistance protein ChrB domain-containing protein [Steroidobacteraceae bacterium]